MVLGLLGLMVPVARATSGGDAYSRTFFSAPTHFQRGKPERETLFAAHDRLDKKDNGWGGMFEVVGYYSQSTNSSELAKFFFPFGKCQLNVAEFKQPVTDSATGSPINPNLDSDWNNLTKDLEARHFNIQTSSGTTTFQSTIKICPKQKVGGIGLAYRQTLWRDCNDEGPRLWLDIAMPIENVKNEIAILETVTSDGGGAVNQLGLDNSPRVSNMTQAFAQSNWNYGKIDGKCRDQWGVSDVEVALGWRTMWEGCCQLDGYLGFIAPTGTKIDKKVAEFVFRPVVGNGHHWALIFGSYNNFDVWSHNNHKIDMAYSMHGQILFKNNQWRSFDLKDKDWSRYAEVYASLADAQAAFAANAADPDSIFGANSGTSGINVFTRCLEINPRYIVDTNSALIYTYRDNFKVELGYNFYVRHAEEAKLCNWDEEIALKGILGNGDVSIARTINKHFRFDDLSESTSYNEAIITKDKLDLNSATHPGVLSNIVYANFAYDGSVCDVPWFVGAGGSYEFSKINTTLSRWTVWGKLGLSF